MYLLSIYLSAYPYFITFQQLMATKAIAEQGLSGIIEETET
jgi:hypothetical protein